MLNQHCYVYVEDHPLGREIMQMMLSVMGIQQFAILPDSSNFMERIHALSFQTSIFLLDIHVQPHDGFTMLAMLRAEPVFQGARIIALTASVMNEEVEQLRQSGFDGAIAKPLSIQTFPAMMQRIVNGESVWHIA
jgi:two-component system cell cycle response regulator DivK